MRPGFIPVCVPQDLFLVEPDPREVEERPGSIQGAYRVCEARQQTARFPPPFCEQVDFWRGPARPSLPVDMRVPFSELRDVKKYLKSHGLAYTVMIKDIQVRSSPGHSVFPTFHFPFQLLHALEGGKINNKTTQNKQTRKPTSG